AARAITEILRQPLGVGPHLSHLATQGKDVATSYGPPLLQAQAGAIEGLAFVQSHAHSQTEVDEVALAGIVTVVDVATEPLPGGDKRGHFVIRETGDARAIFGCNNIPVGLVLDTAVASRLAVLRALPAQAVTQGSYALDVGVADKHAQTVAVARLVGRKMDIKKRSLPVPVDPGARFYPHWLPCDHVLAEKPFDPKPVIAIQTCGGRVSPAWSLGDAHQQWHLDLAIGQGGARSRVTIKHHKRTLKERRVLQRLLPFVQQGLVVGVAGRVID